MPKRPLATLQRHRDGTVDVTVALPGGGTVTVTFAGDDVVAVALGGLGHLTPTGLRRFAWERWITVADAARRTPAHTRQLSAREAAARWDAVQAVNAARKAEQGRGRPWHTTRPPTFYAGIAERYVALRAEGVVNPVTTIAREGGENRNTVAGWVKRARALGYLGPARPGRAG